MLVRRRHKKENRLHQGLWIIVLTTIVIAMFPSIASAPPVYEELEKVKVIDSTIINNTARAENITANAGDLLRINTPLNIPNINGQLLQVSFKLKNSIANAKLTVTVIDKPSTTPPANAIGFFKIDIEGFSDSDIESVEITFRLGNEYVNVQLHRLAEGQWVALPTSRVETGVNFSTYQAESPGFSEFAITAIKGRVSAEIPALPYTSGNPIYVVAIAGIIFLIAGVIIRVKEQVNKGKKVS